MNSLYFPLQSNCSRFSSYTGRLALERRIKAGLILYDELVFQDGRFVRTVLEGGSFENFLPPDQIPDRRKVVYRQPGATAAFRVASEKDGIFHPLLHGSSTEKL